MTKKQWDKNFSNGKYIYGEDPNEFVKQMSGKIPPNSNIACLAEGEGRNAVFLAEQGHHIVAYDQSKVGLDKANQLAEKNNVNIKTETIDLTKECVPQGEYDAAILVFGHVLKKDQQFLFQNLLNSVRSGGHVLFEVYSEKQINYKTGGPGHVEALYDPVDILKFIDQHQVLHFYYGETERYEGLNHTGLGHVIQVVIKKR